MRVVYLCLPNMEYILQVLTHARSYDEALDMLNKHYLAAPVYYILAGSKPNEGAVITRDRSILVNLWQLNVSASVPDSWYLLETNYVCDLCSICGMWCACTHVFKCACVCIHTHANVSYSRSRWDFGCPHLYLV